MRFHSLGPYPVVLKYATLYSPPEVKYNNFMHLIRNHCDNLACVLPEGDYRTWKLGSETAFPESQSMLRFEL